MTLRYFSIQDTSLASLSCVRIRRFRHFQGVGTAGLVKLISQVKEAGAQLIVYLVYSSLE